MSLRKTTSIAIALALLLACQSARASDCTEGGSGDCSIFGVIIVAAYSGLALDTAIGLGGVVTLIGGATDVGTHRNRRGWRIANYVLGSMNLAAATVWGGLAAAGIGRDLALTVGMPQVALGGADLTVAIISGRRAGGADVAVRLAPMSTRDSSGHLVAGVGLQLVGF